MLFRQLLKAISCLTVLVCAAVILPTAVSAGDRSEWQPLFNGENLDGWYTFLQEHGKNNDPDRVISVDDGVIHLYKHAEHGSRVVMGYIATEKDHQDYHLRAEFRWGSKKFQPRLKKLQDAGIFYHMTGTDNVWPQALHFQIEVGHVGDIVTIGHIRYDTHVDPATESEDKPTYLAPTDGGVPHTHGQRYSSTHLAHLGRYERPGWNQIDIITSGDTAEYRLNGHVVNRLKDARRPDPNDPDKFIPLTKGRILLEIEAAEIFYRNISIKSSEESKIQ